MSLEPYVREAGAGEGVICLHSNASASAQWRPLLDRLAPRFHLLAPDTLGAGRSPAWPTDRAVTLRDEVALLEPIFPRAGSRFAIAGHSYGGAIALIAALAHPTRVRALALYEPTLFSLLEEDAPGQAAAAGIRAAVADAARALDAGDLVGAGRRFIDYWMGEGAWDAMPTARKTVVAGSMVNVRGWAHALFDDPTPLAAFRALRVPVLYMVGARSPASSRGVARLLTAVLPEVTVVEYPELGHMAPITHPEIVNDTIARFLDRQLA